MARLTENGWEPDTHGLCGQPWAEHVTTPEAMVCPDRIPQVQPREAGVTGGTPITDYLEQRRRYVYLVVDCPHMVDGDTFDLRVTTRPGEDFGFHIDTYATMRFRLCGVDAVELRTAGGLAAEEVARMWIDAALADVELEVESFKHDVTIPDASFGRWLGDLYRRDTGEHLADVIRAAGYAKPPKP